MEPDAELQRLRAEIDAIDRELLQVAARRLAAARQVGEFKQRHGLPIRDPEREQAMLRNARNNPPQGLQGHEAEALLKQILHWARATARR